MSELRRLAEPLNIGGVDDPQPRLPGADVGHHGRAVPLARLRSTAPGWSCPKWWRAANSPRAGRAPRPRIRHSGLPVHMVQLAGREADHMAEAARIAAGEGADIIDINMGCPAKKVTGGYSGSALMRDLDHALSLIDAVIGAVDVPVTVKMRLGWDEATLNAPLLARRAEQAGVKMVTIHGRTRCQFYQGKADWRAIARVKQAVSIPVVANGDVGDAGRCRGNPRAVRRRRRDGRPRPLRRAVDGRQHRAGGRRGGRPATPGPASAGRLRRRPLRGHAVALRRRKRAEAGAQASRLVSRPPCAACRCRDAQDRS